MNRERRLGKGTPYSLAIAAGCLVWDAIRLASGDGRTAVGAFVLGAFNLGAAALGAVFKRLNPPSTNGQRLLVGIVFLTLGLIMTVLGILQLTEVSSNPQQHLTAGIAALVAAMGFLIVGIPALRYHRTPTGP